MSNTKLYRYVAEVFREHEDFVPGLDYDYPIWAQHEKDAFKIAKRRVAAIHGFGATITIRGRTSGTDD